MSVGQDFGQETRRIGAIPVSATVLGLLIGLVLGVVGAFGGFVAFLVVLVMAAVGTAVGLVLDGRINLVALIDRDRKDR
jgi:hypothetical protein